MKTNDRFVLIEKTKLTVYEDRVVKAVYVDYKEQATNQEDLKTLIEEVRTFDYKDKA